MLYLLSQTQFYSMIELSAKIIWELFIAKIVSAYKSTVLGHGNFIWAQIDHAYDRELLPAPFVMGATITEHQVMSGTEASTGYTFGTNGTSSNTFSYTDTEGNTYTRQVNASNEMITFDNQGGTLAPTAPT
ncbi:hypothetical protein EDB89DRAFT_1910116 [Lactarius sanguifluus]|nr:hypothetical protein EDB89DRAFT_1910116 [Lactarius sanguifluus]